MIISVRWKALLAFLLLAGALTVVLVLTSSGQAPKAFGGQSALSSEVDQFAVNASLRYGDTSPSSVSWVTTNRQAANSLLGAELPDTASGVPVYLLEVKGQFTDFNAKVPRGAKAPTGTILTLVIRQSDGEVVDSGVQDQSNDLSTLGTAQTNSLAGLSPTVTTIASS